MFRRLLNRGWAGRGWWVGVGDKVIDCNSLRRLQSTSCGWSGCGRAALPLEVWQVRPEKSNTGFWPRGRFLIYLMRENSKIVLFLGCLLHLTFQTCFKKTSLHCTSLFYVIRSFPVCPVNYQGPPRLVLEHPFPLVTVPCSLISCQHWLFIYVYFLLRLLFWIHSWFQLSPGHILSCVTQGFPY